MFTGIVEAIGRIVGVEPAGESVRFLIEERSIAAEAAIGESIAVNGVCLTVTALDGARIRFDAVAETLDRSALGRLVGGDRVNLERALRAGGRLDGHIVQGHVDGTGKVRALRRNGEDVRLDIDTSADFVGMLIEKGSVTIDGVALTVVGLRPDGFDVALIPHTLAVTTLGDLAPGTPVNLEADVLGKYVIRYLERVMPAATDGH